MDGNASDDEEHEKFVKLKGECEYKANIISNNRLSIVIIKKKINHLLEINDP